MYYVFEKLLWLRLDRLLELLLDLLLVEQVLDILLGYKQLLVLIQPIEFSFLGSS